MPNEPHGANVAFLGPMDDPHYAYDGDDLPCKVERRSRRNGRSRSKALKACRANKRAHADAWEGGYVGEPVEEDFEVVFEDYGDAGVDYCSVAEVAWDDHDSGANDFFNEVGYYCDSHIAVEDENDGGDARDGPL